jgi:hypothetical protein
MRQLRGKGCRVIGNSVFLMGSASARGTSAASLATGSASGPSALCTTTNGNLIVGHVIVRIVVRVCVGV